MYTIELNDLSDPSFIHTLVKIFLYFSKHLSSIVVAYLGIDHVLSEL